MRERRIVGKESADAIISSPYARPRKISATVTSPLVARSISIAFSRRGNRSPFRHEAVVRALTLNCFAACRAPVRSI